MGINRILLVSDDSLEEFHNTPAFFIFRNLRESYRIIPFGLLQDHRNNLFRFLFLTGKSTLINAMVNYLYRVNWHDDFRFKLIIEEEEEDQTRSQTKEIVAYTLYWEEGFALEFTLTIIDTPGFGDTSGILGDKRILDNMTEFFRRTGPHSVLELEAVGFVLQASQVRLTAAQRYIFDSIQALFGKALSETELKETINGLIAEKVIAVTVKNEVVYTP